MIVLTLVPVRIPECGTLQEIAYHASCLSLPEQTEGSAGVLGCRFAQICQSKPGLGFSTRNSLIYSGFQPLRPFCPSTVWVITCRNLPQKPPVSPKPVTVTSTVTSCWLQRTVVLSNVSPAVEGRFMESITFQRLPCC